MMRRRRRRFSPKWTWANSQTMSINSSGPFLPQGPGGTACDFMWILPPARAQFIMNTKQRDRLQFSGAHLWLDFFWENKGGATGLPDVAFAVYKTVIEATGDQPDFSPILTQWANPSTPASITSWDEDDDDGTNPFCWQHWIKGISPPNSLVAAQTQGTFPDPAQVLNQGVIMGGGTVDNISYLCRKFMVTQEWQPDVVIRSKRTIRKGEGIALVMAVPSPSANLNSVLNVHLRTLTK